MKKLIALTALALTLSCSQTAAAQDSTATAISTEMASTADSASTASAADMALDDLMKFAEEEGLSPEMQDGGFHNTLKNKFIEGGAGFMSLVAITLVLGLAFCIERIVYLMLAETNCRKLLSDIEKKVDADDIEGAKDICRNTRGPVASICYQILVRANETTESIERSIAAYGAVQTANLEKGCSWITMFISIAPSLGFLGTVIGMVMAFDDIRIAGDISPTIVASGMKVALITTIFGIIVAVILQLFYNYILTRIDKLTTQMEDSAIVMVDIITKHKNKPLC